MNWFALAQDICLNRIANRCEAADRVIARIDARQVSGAPTGDGGKGAGLGGSAPKYLDPTFQSSETFVERIQRFLDMREAERAGEVEYTGDYEAGLARERGY